MGRLYTGWYQVRVIIDSTTGEDTHYVGPLTYEECEFVCMMFGAGYLFKQDKEVSTVKRAKIVKQGEIRYGEEGKVNPRS